MLCCWLTGLGDLQLAPDFMQHQVKQMTWNNMTVDAADAKFKKLMKDNGTLCAKYILFVYQHALTSHLSPQMMSARSKLYR